MAYLQKGFYSIVILMLKHDFPVIYISTGISAILVVETPCFSFRYQPAADMLYPRGIENQKLRSTQDAF